MGEMSMGGFLGVLAGGGMLALIGVLVAAFLREMNWLKADGARFFLRHAALACAVGVLHYLLAALTVQVTQNGTLQTAADLGRVFPGTYMQWMIWGLSTGEWVGPVSGLFTWLGHTMGKVLFGQYVFSGVVLAFCMAIATVCLVGKRLEAIGGEKAGLNMTCLLLTLPGSVFLFLPGWAPIACLGLAVLFFVAGRRIKKREFRLNPVAFGWALAVFSLLSAMVTVSAALGKAG